ncbi:hypothetical protein AB0M34_13160 [Nocardia sp. NPDC050193]
MVEITANLRERIYEAQAKGWTGEVEGLRVSLNAAASKLSSLDRMLKRSPSSIAELGIPVLR